MWFLKPGLAAALALCAVQFAEAQTERSEPRGQSVRQQLAYQDRQAQDQTVRVRPGDRSTAAPDDARLRAFHLVRDAYDARYGEGAWARRYGFPPHHDGR